MTRSRVLSGIVLVSLIELILAGLLLNKIEAAYCTWQPIKRTTLNVILVSKRCYALSGIIRNLNKDTSWYNWANQSWMSWNKEKHPKTRRDESVKHRWQKCEDAGWVGLDALSGRMVFYTKMNRFIVVDLGLLTKIEKAYALRLGLVCLYPLPSS